MGLTTISEEEYNRMVVRAVVLHARARGLKFGSPGYKEACQKIEDRVVCAMDRKYRVR